MRTGLVGYNCNTGLGELNRQLSVYGNICSWLVQRHPHKGYKKEAKVPIILEQVDNFLDGVDIVIFCERPYFKDLIDKCKDRRKKTICIPMQEWMPSDLTSWPKEVDLFICPTLHCYDQFKNDLPCTYFSWPVDLAITEFKLRTKCEKFLFINGNGGWKGRKGYELIKQLDVPIIVHSQKQKEVDNIGELYKEGDVLLAPHSVDGIGLEINEAMSAGIPVVTPNGAPWNERPAITRIEATVERRHINREVDWYLPLAEHLKYICNTLLNQDITEQSKDVYEWAKKNAWTVQQDVFKRIIEELWLS